MWRRTRRKSLFSTYPSVWSCVWINNDFVCQELLSLRIVEELTDEVFIYSVHWPTFSEWPHFNYLSLTLSSSCPEHSKTVLIWQCFCWDLWPLKGKVSHKGLCSLKGREIRGYYYIHHTNTAGERKWHLVQHIDWHTTRGHRHRQSYRTTNTDGSVTLGGEKKMDTSTATLKSTMDTLVLRCQHTWTVVLPRWGACRSRDVREALRSSSDSWSMPGSSGDSGKFSKGQQFNGRGRTGFIFFAVVVILMGVTSAPSA